VADETVRLIETLAAEARPVRRLRPPALRAALWLGTVGALIALAIWLFSDLTLSLQRLQNARLDWEMAGMLLTGILAEVLARLLYRSGGGESFVVRREYNAN